MSAGRPTELAHRLRQAYVRYARRGTRYRREQQALHVLTPLSTPYLPWTGFAMRPSAIVTVLNDVVLNARASIVECGGGISTFYIARLLRERGGHLHTVEHDEDWAMRLRAGLQAEGLDQHATVTFAPLAKSPLGVDGHPWYTDTALQWVADARPVDLLLVDGPTASAEFPYIRYPALPFFAPALADDCTIVLDDVSRLGEELILRRWERTYGWSFERRYLDGMIAIKRPAGALGD